MMHAELPTCDSAWQAWEGAAAQRTLPPLPDASADVPQQVSATQFRTVLR